MQPIRKRKINHGCESGTNKKCSDKQQSEDAVNVGGGKEPDAPHFHYIYYLKKEIQVEFGNKVALSVVVESIYKVCIDKNFMLYM